MDETTVVLGLEDPALQEEVLHFLDRRPRIRVVAAASGKAALAQAIREARPDAAVVSPTVAGSGELDGAAVFVVGERETTEALRGAIRAGARGFYLWPEERETLGRDAERASRSDHDAVPQMGKVVAVYGARGGAGATFVATHLAAACAAQGAETVLVDLDTVHADVTAALGMPGNGSTPTLTDLGPVLDELVPEHVDRVLQSHPRGFQVLLAPHEPSPDGIPSAPRVSALIRVLRTRFEAVILHLPRWPHEGVRAAAEAADRILLPVTLDVLAFRDARRTLAWLEGIRAAERARLVVNRATKADVVPEDCERVFGMRPVAVFGMDRSIPRAQDRGQLVVGRSGRTARRLASLAALALADDEDRTS